MKLIRQMPLPEKLKRRRKSRYFSLALKLRSGDGYEGCTGYEAHNLYYALMRLGHESITMKTNGHGYRIWRLT